MLEIFLTYEAKLQEELVGVGNLVSWEFIITVVLEQLAWVAGLYADLNKFTAEEQVKVLFIYLTDLLQNTSQLDKIN